MPRIYAQNPDHTCDWLAVPFINGASAVAAGEDTAYFTDCPETYTIDGSKDKLELWDRLPIAQLDELLAYFGVAIDDTDTKYEKVRALEAAISGNFADAVTVASAAATAGDGKTKITITSPGTGDYYFKSAATTAPAPLYGDVVTAADGWQLLELTAGVADEVEPNAETDDKFTVVEVSDSGTVVAIGSGDLTVKS